MSVHAERWKRFQPCPQCSFDFATGEGERACSWGDCPYLPEELNVMCDACRFDFVTMEGNASCADPATCDEGAPARSHVANVREWSARRRVISDGG
jgi:hypothetical protein